MRGIVPDVARIVRLSLFLSSFRVVAPLLRRFPQLVEFAVHSQKLSPELAKPFLFVFGEGRVFAVLLRLLLLLLVAVIFAEFLVARILFLEIFVEFSQATKAVAVAVAVARVHGWTVYFVASEDVVPNVFEDTAGKLIVHAGCQEPFSVVDEALNGHFLDALARDGELGAADSRDGGRDGGAGVDLLPDLFAPVDFLWFVEEVKIAAGTVHVYPVGTARFVVAAHIHVTHAGDAIVVEALDHLGSVEAEEHVVVPCVAVGVHEDDGVGKVVVVVDDVGEVDLEGAGQPACTRNGSSTCVKRASYHGLAALVLGDLVLGIGIVDFVDYEGRIGNLGLHPANVLLLGLGDDNRVRVIAPRRLAHRV